MSTKLISLEVLSDRLGGLARSSITRRVKSGELPAPVRIGRRLYWDEADIEVMIADLKAKTA